VGPGRANARGAAWLRSPAPCCRRRRRPPWGGCAGAVSIGWGRGGWRAGRGRRGGGGGAASDGGGGQRVEPSDSASRGGKAGAGGIDGTATAAAFARWGGGAGEVAAEVPFPSLPPGRQPQRGRNGADHATRREGNGDQKRWGDRGCGQPAAAGELCFPRRFVGLPLGMGRVCDQMMGGRWVSS
jgi:hypothetical protein